jgi:hypothetical protein
MINFPGGAKLVNSVDIETNNSEHDYCTEIKYIILLVILVFGVLLIIEYIHPYFFLNDDNRDYFLPYYIYNYKSLLKGELALYNFHQFLGTPHLAVGQSAVLYPIMYISVFLSQFIFGHYFAVIDIQVIIHLIISAVGFYKLMRFFNVNNDASYFGGLTWSLCSFVVYVSNSWVVVSAVAAYFPLMILFSLKMLKEKTKKAEKYTVLFRLLLFYSGHIQYFIYSVIFEFITASLYFFFISDSNSKKVGSKEFIITYAKSYLKVLILSLPLLLPMYNQANISASKSQKLNFILFVIRTFQIRDLLTSLLLPNIGKSYYSFLSYIGFLPIYFILIEVMNNRINFKFKTIINVFIIPMIVALLWSSSKQFNSIVYIIPILNRFRWPFKIALYFDFYLIGISTFAFHKCINVYKKGYYKVIVILVIFIQTLNLTVLYIYSPINFGTHTDKVPLEEKLTDGLEEGRIISLGFDIWKSNNNSSFITAPSIAFNYATLWGLNYFAGYEPMVSKANYKASLNLNFTAVMNTEDIPIEYLRETAVSWYIVPKNKEHKYTSLFSKYKIFKKYEDENRVVFYDYQASPMIYQLSNTEVEIENYKVYSNKISLNLDLEKPDTIVFNYIHNPFFKGFVDGNKVEINKYNDLQFSIDIPVGQHEVLIRYMDSNFIIGSIFVLLYLSSNIIIIIIKKSKDFYIR